MYSLGPGWSRYTQTRNIYKISGKCCLLNPFDKPCRHYVAGLMFLIPNLTVSNFLAVS